VPHLGLISPLQLSTLRNAPRDDTISHEDHMHSVALSDMMSDRSTTAKHFVVGMSGDNKD